MDLPTRFQDSWSFTRELTADLLESLDEEALAFSPGHGLGPLWQQFRHLGRIQSNYEEALRTGRIRFGEPGIRCRGTSRSALLSYLATVDASLMETLETLDWEATVDWEDEEVDAFEHLRRMSEHESFHHGQFVVYVQALETSFPESWTAFGF